MAEPAATPVTRPPEETVALVASEDAYVAAAVRFTPLLSTTFNCLVWLAPAAAVTAAVAGVATMPETASFSFVARTKLPSGSVTTL